jgi:hypothetical protein
MYIYIYVYIYVCVIYIYIYVYMYIWYMYIWYMYIIRIQLLNFPAPWHRDRPRHRRGLFLNGAPRQRAADVSLHQRQHWLLAGRSLAK